eukprot:1149598-Pelagomonas_calceolata.AAC.2
MFWRMRPFMPAAPQRPPKQTQNQPSKQQQSSKQQNQQNRPAAPQRPPNKHRTNPQNITAHRPPKQQNQHSEHHGSSSILEAESSLGDDGGMGGQEAEASLGGHGCMGGCSKKLRNVLDMAPGETAWCTTCQQALAISFLKHRTSTGSPEFRLVLDWALADYCS